MSIDLNYHDFNGFFQTLVDAGDIKKSTMITYMWPVNACCKHFAGGDKNASIIPLFSNISATIEFIEAENTNANTLGSKLTPFCKALSVNSNNVPAWQALYDVLQDDARISSKVIQEKLAAYKSVASNERNKPKRSEVDYYELWSQLKTIESHLRETEYASLNHLWISMFTLIPPRRREDYMCVHIRKTATEKWKTSAATKQINYMIVKDGKCVMVLNKFKTVDAMGAYTVALPADLCAIIIAHLQSKQKYLFSHTNASMKGSAYTNPTTWGKFCAKTLSTLYNQIITPPVSVELSINDIRHAYVCWLKSKYREITSAQMQEAAIMMGKRSMTDMDGYRIVDRIHDATDVLVGGCAENECQQTI